MATAVLSVILLLSLSLNAEDLTDISCPESQEAFDDSCYELVSLQRPFPSAQSWCERGGGHLAFILNDEAQQFLQKHLDPGKDWWLGLAPAAPNLTLDSAASTEYVSYNNWVTSPHADTACGHILRNSGFQWEATENCSQELNFICQFDSGSTIACDGQNATLQCGSGQVIEIDDSFYGRKTIHYCKSSRKSPTSTQEECSWIDVCSTSDWHVTAQQAITIQEPVGDFGVITCYSQNQSSEGPECQALYGKPLQLHVVVEAGTNVTFEIQSGGIVVANVSAAQGAMGHNITVSTEMTEQLGPGCHDVTVHATNRVTPAGVSTELRLCLLELVDNLKASVVAEEGSCPPDSLPLAFRVSLERGGPAMLLFSLIGDRDNRSETRDMLNGSLQEYHFTDPWGNMTTPSSYQLEISATPQLLVDRAQSVQLTVTGAEALTSNQEMAFTWSCGEQCNIVF
ncbi:hypothetical protein CRUP_034339 [Coryphaenoides rupestris]|nr:hypothetical protein CRUP_034339 [Coryphaenoides rupestris]